MHAHAALLESTNKQRSQAIAIKLHRPCWHVVAEMRRIFSGYLEVDLVPLVTPGSCHMHVSLADESLTAQGGEPLVLFGPGMPPQLEILLSARPLSIADLVAIT